jgi:hypothetical protein
MDKKRFVFIAHWVETWNILLKCNKDLHRHPDHAWRWMWLWPAFFVISLFYLFGKKSYEEVDGFQFNGKLEGKIALIRNFGWQFFLKGQREKIKARILETVLSEQKNADVIGLGALTKAEWLTAGGKWVVDQLGDKLKVSIVHGDTLTAGAVIKRVLQIGLAPIFLTGSTSKIGRAVALDLARRGMTVKLLTESENRFKEIWKEAGDFNQFLFRASSLEDGKDCPLWVTGKAKPAGRNLLRHIPKGAIVINSSVPNPVSERLFKVRPDIRFVEGGLLAFDPKKSTQSFNMRLWEGETYACHAGTMLHAYMGWTDHEVGHVNMEKIWAVWDAAVDLGFFLSPLPQEQEEVVSAGVRSRWGRL